MKKDLKRYKNPEKRETYMKEYYAKKTAKGYRRSKTYRKFRKEYRAKHPISKARKKYQRIWKAKQRENFKELIFHAYPLTT